MRQLLQHWGWGVLSLCLLIPSGLRAAPEMEKEVDPRPKEHRHIQQTAPALWTIQERSHSERRERFLREIRKLYLNEEGSGIK